VVRAKSPNKVSENIELGSELAPVFLCADIPTIEKIGKPNIMDPPVHQLSTLTTDGETMHVRPVSKTTRSITATIFAATFILTTVQLSEVSMADSTGGGWKGEWISETTGHHGPLRARIRKLDDNHYRAVFAGRFFKVIPFVYPTKLERVSSAADESESTSETLRSIQRLPLLGTYEMEATVTDGHFHADYKSKRDSGSFILSR